MTDPIGISTATQTIITAGCDEYLVVICDDASRHRNEDYIIQPRGMHFVGSSANQLQGTSSENTICSSGRKPPRVPRVTTNQNNQVGPIKVNDVEITPAGKMKTGPLHAHSPGLSPIPAGVDGQDQEDVVGGDSAKLRQHENSSALRGDIGNDDEIQYEDDDDNILSIRALDDEFKHSMDVQQKEGIIYDQFTSSRSMHEAMDGSLRMMSLLASELSVDYDAPRTIQQLESNTSQQVMTNKYQDSGVIFSIAVDKEGSPVLVELNSHNNNMFSKSVKPIRTSDDPSIAYHLRPSSSSPPGILGSPQSLGSRYWRDRLHRRQISSILSSPICNKFL